MMPPTADVAAAVDALRRRGAMFRPSARYLLRDWVREHPMTRAQRRQVLDAFDEPLR
jgi:hypothetical protein